MKFLNKTRFSPTCPPGICGILSFIGFLAMDPAPGPAAAAVAPYADMDGSIESSMAPLPTGTTVSTDMTPPWLEGEEGGSCCRREAECCCCCRCCCCCCCERRWEATPLPPPPPPPTCCKKQEQTLFNDLRQGPCKMSK